MLLQSEGGNNDDPKDHGGRTSRGVTQREYDAWRREKNLPTLDVWEAPQSDIDTIYYEEYWLPWCPNFPMGVDYLFFNNNVLDGTKRSAILLQRALSVAEDGRIGPITRQAVSEANPITLITRLSDVSAAFYRNLNQPRFIRGWLYRVNQVKNNALSMVAYVNKIQ